MNRRKYLQTMAAAGAVAAVDEAAGAAAAAPPIQLHVDLDVDAAKEKELVSNFQTIFKPTIRKQPGFVEVKLMKLRKAMKGSAPANTSYRLLISFQTEAQRVTWVATADHQRVWPSIEKNLKGEKFSAVLFDLV